MRVLLLLLYYMCSQIPQTNVLFAAINCISTYFIIIIITGVAFIYCFYRRTGWQLNGLKGLHLNKIYLNSPLEIFCEKNWYKGCSGCV